MELTGVQKLARVLRILVTVTFVCNLVALVLVAGLVVSGNDVLSPVWSGVTFRGWVKMMLLGWTAAFQRPYTAVLTLFLLFAGTCTAVILWQGRRVLNSVLAGDTFTFGNAANMRRAAVCCFLISAAAFCRMVWSLCYFPSPLAMITYNTLFVPIFLMAGLLCMVMSALFRQAAELKAENDLTI